MKVATAKNRESNFWKQVRTNLPESWIATRIESWAVPGVPDTLLCDSDGQIHLIELKVCTANAVRLSPHQVSFLTRHAHASAWVLIKKQPFKDRAHSVLLYRGADAIALATDGLSGAEPAGHWRNPVPWADVFSLVKSHT